MKKLNKLLIITTILISTFFSIIANAQKSVKNFIGPSVVIGIQSTGTKLNVIEGYQEDQSGLNKSSSKDLIKLSAQYGIETHINNFLMNIGASYVPEASTVNISSDEGDSLGNSIILKNVIAVYIEPTYVLSETTSIFGKLSYNKADSYFNGYDGDPGAGASKNIYGTGLGLGVTHFLRKDFFLKAEIETVHYGTNTYDADYDPYLAKTKQRNATIALGMKF